MQPLTALALYDEYRELTPAGSEGDEMIGRLADRLVGVDLLDRAVALPDHQIKFRLKGEKRAEAGTKLALVHLVKPQAKGSSKGVAHYLPAGTTATNSGRSAAHACQGDV